MGKAARFKAVESKKALESRLRLFLSLITLNDRRLADNSIEILSGVQTYFKDVYFCLATCGSSDDQNFVDSHDSFEQHDRIEQLGQKLLELRRSLGLLRDWKQALDLAGNGYESTRFVTEFSHMSKIYCSFLKYEKEACRIVLDIWTLIQVLDTSSLVDHVDYSTYMSDLYEKIKEGSNIRFDFSEEDLYVELKSLAASGSCEATYLCERLDFASRRPVTPSNLIERIGYALKVA